MPKVMMATTPEHKDYFGRTRTRRLEMLITWLQSPRVSSTGILMTQLSLLSLEGKIGLLSV